MHMPEHLKTPGITEKVFVVFTIDENGAAHIVEMSKCTPETQASITKQFETIDFSGTGHNAQQTYSIWLKFNMM